MKKQKIVFVTGPEINEESGIANNGFVLNRAPAVFEKDGVLDIPAYLAAANELRQQIAQAHPNTVHIMIADLEKDYDVSVITYNLDNLHERAGSTHVLHLYGQLTKVCSTRHPNSPEYIREYPLTTPINVGDDAGDGSQLRPYVWTPGDFPSNTKERNEIIDSADVVVSVGVFPFGKRGISAGSIAERINLRKDLVKYYITDKSDVDVYINAGYRVIQGKPVDGMRELIKELVRL
jgi:NAD-dependent deacetylase